MELNADFPYLNETTLENLTREEGKYIEVSKEIANDVESKKITIVDVIKRLECLLLSQSFSKRDLGVLLLSETLHKLKDNSLNPDQLSVLSAYFCEKFKDHHQVATSALRGTLALISFTNNPSNSIIQLISHIFNHITCQQQQQQHRYLIFQIYETVLEKHEDEVNLMGIDFVYGVISSIDGERDPKNLLYLFSWLQKFLNTVKLGHLTEEMFDVLSCYFPVDFKAPPSDKIQITREDLAQGLCKCLTSIADFGQYSIPLALEKLESTLKIAKEDSLDLLQAGCNNYKTETYYQHSIEIWSYLQKEIFNTSDEQLKFKCLQTLEEIILKLSQGDLKNFENTILDIADTLKGNILPTSKLFTQSSEILIYVARASALSSMLVAKKVAPLLENTFKITSNGRHKALILYTFIEFVKAIIETNVEVDLSNIEEISSCPSLCSQAILDKEPDLIVVGYEGFTAIVQFIPENVRYTYLQNLQEALVAPLASNVKYVVLKSLEKFAEIYPHEVEEHVLYKDIICDITTIDNYLESLSNIVKLTYFQDYVINTFISYATTSTASSAVALKHLNHIFSNIMDITELLVKKDFITQLLDFLVSLNTIDSFSNNFFDSIKIILQSIIRNQDALSQKSIYLTHSSRSFQNQDIYLVILSGLIVPLQRGVFEEYDKIDYLLYRSVNATNESMRNMSLEVLANVLNKINNEDVLEEKLNTIRTSCDNCNSETRVWLISWTIKALLTRNHPQALQWADLLLNCLKDDECAAKGFRIIMDESYRVISKENYCQIMPLYKQKIFIYCTNKLNKIVQTDCVEYLNAVGYLIENAPKLAIVGHFQKILRLVLLCLEICTEPRVLEILLQRIREFVIDGESVIEDNLEDILLRILKLTHFEPSMIVRIAAIRCLHQMTVTYKIYKLLPYKSEAIQQLGVCVDDKKRLVRGEAMECRSLWYLLDAPE